MRLLAIISAVALQVVVLAYMAAEREWILANGRTVWLRTAPVDPRDAMRGDYVRLDYDISHVPSELCRDGLEAEKKRSKLPPDTRLYAGLNVDESGLAEVSSLSDKNPPPGLFVRGRLESGWGESVRVRYGIEAFFLEQGSGWIMEHARQRRGIQVPLEMQVALSPSGVAVIKEYRRSVLGIGLELNQLPRSQTSPWQRPAPLSAKVRLSNEGTNDLAIVDLPGSRSLALVTDSQWAHSHYRWVHAGEPRAKPSAENIVVLKPKQVHAISVDFRDPNWFMVDTSGKAGTPKPLADVLQQTQVRLIYIPPTREECLGLPNANLIWHGRMPTTAITSFGID